MTQNVFVSCIVKVSPLTSEALAACETFYRTAYCIEKMASICLCVAVKQVDYFYSLGRILHSLKTVTS